MFRLLQIHLALSRLLEVQRQLPEKVF